MKTHHIIPALIALLLIASLSGCGPGASRPDPTHGYIATKVTRVWVDTASSGWGEYKETVSHYMVGTLDGVFEVDNVYGVVAADEIYARIEPGQRYQFEIRGPKILTRHRQQYPYILSATLLPGDLPVESR